MKLGLPPASESRKDQDIWRRCQLHEADVSINPPDVTRKSKLFRRLTTGLGGLAVVLLALAGYSEWLSAQAARRYPPRGSLSDAVGAQLHYRDVAPSHTPKGTVVLVHGAWSGHADLLAALGPHLREYRVIAIDRPGQGWSKRPGGWEMADPRRQAEAVMVLLDRIAPERLVVVAHSLAGPLSTHIALERPERLDGLVLLSAVTHPWLGSAARYHGLSTSSVVGPIFNRVIGIPVTSLLLQKGAHLAFAPQVLAPGYAATGELPLIFREPAFRSNLQDIVTADRILRRQVLRYGQLKVPVIAITGDRDAFLSPVRHSAAMARAAPQGRLLVLPGVGHMPHHARPEVVVEAIEGLLRRS